MPLAIGYHPYFQLTDTQARRVDGQRRREEALPLSPQKLPTGETEPIEKFFADPAAGAGARTTTWTTSSAIWSATRRAASTMTVKGKAQRLDVIFGPNYKVAVVWAPKPPAGQERNFICFEPMVGITNAVNMAHKGTYSELQIDRARARRGARAGGSSRAGSRPRQS